MNEELMEISFGLIANAGEAKGLAYDALSKAKAGNFEEAKELIKKEVGIIFSRVLEDAGVFNRNEKGQEGFNKFLNKAI